MFVDLVTQSPPSVLGQDPTSITAWATLALAFVGSVGIITGGALAVAGWRQANAAKRSNTLQLQELQLLESQLDLTRQEMALRSATSKEEREQLELQARVNLTVAVTGGSHQTATPPRNVQPFVVVTNHGPGVAASLSYGVRRNGREVVANPRPEILGPDKTLQANPSVPDEVVADVIPSPGESPMTWLEAWARYTDATGARWETTSDGQTQRKSDSK